MDDIIARYEHAYAHDIDAETADRHRQKQPLLVDRYPLLEMVPATPELLARLGWTWWDSWRLGITWVLVPATEKGAR